ncbi:lytic transglycosylase domain-containing protein [Cytophagales bacterium LB-30]|uniref:Lytic transglycosylase domain-containing protein n=1 Tax=Shiella aurantiaca TaxID=3058365 RepID=A0ABT8F603_9BACT|nr:lytic transglycosylase domain-containing protein [Shiella aurantiaca]MDN4165892.1 lytic transglycosylase domain-containing protein [Shiella aurantiaca]
MRIARIIALVVIGIAILWGGYFIYQDSLTTPYVPIEKHQAFKWKTFAIPESITFAGERIPLDDPEVRERLDRELHINTYYNSNTIFVIKRANRWFEQIEAVLKEQGVPDDFKYLAVIESNLMNGRSHKGAVGFWQLLEPTAKELGLEVTTQVDERFDPIKSTYAACKYLKKAYARFDNWTNVAASYNMGMYGLHKQLVEQDVDSYYDLWLNEETARYVFRIIALKIIMEDPETYGYDIPRHQLYQAPELRLLEVKESIPDLVTFSIAQGINFKILKQYNPWLRDKKLTLGKDRSSYTLAIPENPPTTLQYKDLGVPDSLEESRLKMSGEI